MVVADPARVAALLEQLLVKVRDTGHLGHPGVLAVRDELLMALASGEVILELTPDGASSGGAPVLVVPPEQRSVLGAAHRDGLRSLVLPQGCPSEDLLALAECLARAARRSRQAPFDAQSLLAEKHFTALRWGNEAASLHGGADAVAADAPDAWFFGEAIPAPDVAALKPLRKR